jgi:hypothetical protein
MKTIITCVLALSLSIAAAQAEKKTTVRVKKIENINGVEKTTDTTYVLDGTSGIKLHDGTINIDEAAFKACDGKISKEKIMIIDNNVQDESIVIDEDAENGIKTISINSDKGANGNPEMHKIVFKDPNGQGERTIIMNTGKKMSEEDQKAFNENAKADGQLLTDIMIINQNEVDEAKKDGKKIVSIIKIKAIKVTELTPEDAVILNKISAMGDQKLKAEEMKFYPNPSNGKFNLAFNLTTKGDTEINIMNIEGKNVYSEKLPGFSGRYDKEIDISQNPKGTYFVKITQGDHTQVKKVVLE